MVVYSLQSIVIRIRKVLGALGAVLLFASSFSSSTHASFSGFPAPADRVVQVFTGAAVFLTAAGVGAWARRDERTDAAQASSAVSPHHEDETVGQPEEGGGAAIDEGDEVRDGDAVNSDDSILVLEMHDLDIRGSALAASQELPPPATPSHSATQVQCAQVENFIMGRPRVWATREDITEEIERRLSEMSHTKLRGRRYALDPKPPAAVATLALQAVATSSGEYPVRREMLDPSHAAGGGRAGVPSLSSKQYTPAAAGAFFELQPGDAWSSYNEKRPGKKRSSTARGRQSLHPLAVPLPVAVDRGGASYDTGEDSEVVISSPQLSFAVDVSNTVGMPPQSAAEMIAQAKRAVDDTGSHSGLADTSISHDDQQPSILVPEFQVHNTHPEGAGVASNVGAQPNSARSASSSSDEERARCCGLLRK